MSLNEEKPFLRFPSIPFLIENLISTRKKKKLQSVQMKCTHLRNGKKALIFHFTYALVAIVSSLHVVSVPFAFSDVTLRPTEVYFHPQAKLYFHKVIIVSFIATFTHILTSSEKLL